jgi:hypothetical protein
MMVDFKASFVETVLTVPGGISRFRDYVRIPETVIDGIKPRPLAQPLEAYRQALNGEGPLSAEWSDKPHRLLYDLLAALLLAGTEQVDDLNDYWRGMGGIGKMGAIWADQSLRGVMVECLIQKLEWMERVTRI